MGKQPLYLSFLRKVVGVASRPESTGKGRRENLSLYERKSPPAGRKTSGNPQLGRGAELPA